MEQEVQRLFGGGDGLGAADAGFSTRGMEGQERTSRMARSMPYNKTQEAATGMTKLECMEWIGFAPALF